MSQGDVYEFLKKNAGEWYSTKDIADGIGSTPNYVGTKLTKMMDFFPEIERWVKHDGGYQRRWYRYNKDKKVKGIKLFMKQRRVFEETIDEVNRETEEEEDSEETMDDEELLSWEEYEEKTIFGKHYAMFDEWGLNVKELDIFYEHGWEYIHGGDDTEGTLFKKRDIDVIEKIMTGQPETSG